MTKILVLCTGNSARSQMAEGLFRDLGTGRIEVFSAGTHPSSVRSEAIHVMREAGIDISMHRSKSVEEFLGQPMDYVITVCDHARESCPIFPDGTTYLHWPHTDPAAVEGSEEMRLAAFRQVRDQLAIKIAEFAAQL